jgi:hypothetical protein
VLRYHRRRVCGLSRACPSRACERPPSRRTTFAVWGRVNATDRNGNDGGWARPLPRERFVLHPLHLLSTSIPPSPHPPRSPAAPVDPTSPTTPTPPWTPHLSRNGSADVQCHAIPCTVRRARRSKSLSAAEGNGQEESKAPHDGGGSVTLPVRREHGQLLAAAPPRGSGASSLYSPSRAGFQPLTEGYGS